MTDHAPSSSSARSVTTMSAPSRRSVRVRRWLAFQSLPRGDDTIDADVELVGDASRLEHLAGVGARGHHRALEPGLTYGAEITPGARVDRPATAAEALQQDFVLAVAEAMHGL